MIESFIGNKVVVVDSPNKDEKKINGIIKKETKYSFTINGKIILKNKRKFKINNKIINGECTIGKYQERIK